MFVGLTSQFFHNALESRPFLRLQRDELEPDAAVAAPAYHGLLNGQSGGITGGLDAKFKSGAWMHGCRAQDPATAQGQIDDIALPADAVDRTEGTAKVN